MSRALMSEQVWRRSSTATGVSTAARRSAWTTTSWPG